MFLGTFSKLLGFLDLFVHSFWSDVFVSILLVELQTVMSTPWYRVTRPRSACTPCVPEAVALPENGAKMNITLLETNISPYCTKALLSG